MSGLFALWLVRLVKAEGLERYRRQTVPALLVGYQQRKQLKEHSPLLRVEVPANAGREYRAWCRISPPTKRLEAHPHDCRKAITMANSGAFVKGQKKPNQGKRGPNKATVEFRETVQRLLDDNRENVQRWLTLVAEGDGTDKGQPDPGKALDLLAKLAEFAAPKLARTEHTGEGGGPVRVIASSLDERI